MKVRYEATQEEVLKLLYDALCSGLPTFALCGFELDYKAKDYKEAKAALLAGGMEEDRICIEDVQTQMLRMGRDLKFINHEEDGEVTRFNLALALKNWDKLTDNAPRAMGNYISDNYDADDTDNIWQVLMFGEVLYG